VLPAAQVVPPVHPCPPHCPYLATIGPVGAAVVGVEGAVVVCAGVDGVVGEEPPPVPGEESWPDH
jgi:hypothetical protein